MHLNFLRPTLFSAAILSALASPPAHLRAQENQNFTIDRVAIEALDRAQASSIRDNREYCGLIGYDPSGKLGATKPRRGQLNRCKPPADPAGWRVIAVYHTHGAYSQEIDTEVPSIGDLQVAFREQVDDYVATPGGRVWHVSATNYRAVMLCGINCVTADNNYQSCPAMVPTSIYTLSALHERAKTDDGSC